MAGCELTFAMILSSEPAILIVGNGQHYISYCQIVIRRTEELSAMLSYLVTQTQVFSGVPFSGEVPGSPAGYLVCEKSSVQLNDRADAYNYKKLIIK